MFIPSPDFKIELLDKLAPFYPKETTNYIKFNCPKCKQPDAFIYPSAGWYSRGYCNHRNSCGWQEKAGDFLEIPKREFSTSVLHGKGEQEAFKKHGLEIDKLLSSGLIGQDDEKKFTISFLKQGNTHYCKRLKWSPKDNKYRWFNDKGLDASLLGANFYPVLQSYQSDSLYVVEGDWDLVKAVMDGLAATSPIFGASVSPKMEKDWAIFAPYKVIKIAYDLDAAGQSASAKLAMRLKEKFPDKLVLIVKYDFPSFNDGKDYCDYRKIKSVDDFLNLPGVPVDPKKTKAELKQQKDKAQFEDQKTKAEKKPQPFSEILKVVPNGTKKFLVTDAGLFMMAEHKHPFTEETYTQYEKICSDPVVIKDRVQINQTSEMAYVSKESAYVTLGWRSAETIIPLSYLQSKNSDKLADRNITIISNSKAKELSEYFELAIVDVPTRLVYGKLGWHKDKFVVRGLVDDREIMPEAMLDYHLTSGDVEKGIAALKALTQVEQNKAFLPVMVAALSAPAAQALGIKRFKYATFIDGITGNYKTTLAKYAMMLYGKAFLDKFIKFDKGATYASIIKTCGIANDLPILIDNYKPNIGLGERGLTELISAIVEGKDKLRLDEKSNFRPTETLGAWPIITGEAFIETDTSAIARSIQVEFKRAENAIEYLEIARENEDHLPSVGKAWIEWLMSEQGKTYAKAASDNWKEIYRKWYTLASGHGVQNAERVSANFACQELVFSLLCICPLFKWVEAYAKEFMHLLATCMKNMARTTVEAREGVRFLDALAELISSAKVGLLPNKTTKASLGDTKTTIGWDSEDENIIYLLPTITIEEVRKLINLKITKSALYRQLQEEDALEKTSDKTTVLVWLGQKAERVLAVKRKKLISKELVS